MIINSQIDLHNKKIEKNKLEKNDTKILLENIKEKTKKLDNLLETFLFLSRIENKIESLEKVEINFSEYLENFTKKYLENNDINKKYLEKNIEIKYKINKNIFLNIEENTFNILF
jgi:signal transduction histidine kinase